MTQYLNEDHGRGPMLGCGSDMKQFLLLGVMEAMKSPGGKILVGHDPAKPGSDRTVENVPRGHQPSFVHLDEWPFYLREEDKPPSGIICYDEQGPWPPVPVDPIVAKHAKLRIEKAAAKRKRKNRKRKLDSLNSELGYWAQKAKQRGMMSP